MNATVNSKGQPAMACPDCGTGLEVGNVLATVYFKPCEGCGTLWDYADYGQGWEFRRKRAERLSS